MIHFTQAAYRRHRMEKKGRFIRSLAIALAAHAVLFLFLALFIVPGQVVSRAPSITFVAAQVSGSGKAGGSASPAGVVQPRSGRKGAPKTVTPAAPAIPRPTPLPQAQTTQAPQARQPQAQLPLAQLPLGQAAQTQLPLGQAAQTQLPLGQAAQTQQPQGPAAQATSPEGANGARGGAGGPSGSGGGTASASPPETDVDPLTSVADINPVPMWTIDPSYPSSARLLGEEGLVKVETAIDAKGAVIACRVGVSSGFGSLDSAALAAVQRARFLPAMKNGRPVASKILIPIRFQLTRD